MRHWVSLALFFALSSTALFSQTIVFEEGFDEGSLYANSAWANHDPRHRITLDSTRFFSPPASLKVSTADRGTSSLSYIEAGTRIYGTRFPFELSEKIYIESVVDEGIPFLMSGQGTSFVLFLMPNGLVQLVVLKDPIRWVPVTLNVSDGYTLNRWIDFRVTYNGADSVSLYIDGILKGSIAQALMTAPVRMTIGNPSTGHTSTFYVDDIRITRGSIPPPGKPGTVLIMPCSDTGTWDGQDVNVERNNVHFGLFSDPGANSYKVINPEFRREMKDSRGNPMVFTWFLIGGGILSKSTSLEVQEPWIGNLEAIKRYHDTDVRTVGDELAFHYHNWVWNDPDHDGISHWNQSTKLDEWRGEFLETIGRLVIDGREFPTAFRSGWHYMDSTWETLIDSLIPYRFENTSPDQHDDTTEPIDNIYNWSLTPRECVPYHPSPTDYQVPGTLKGWETRCSYMKRAAAGSIFDAFSAAADGKNQFVTVWSHLPEGDFPDQIRQVDSVVQDAAQAFAGISFEYVRATDGMKRWRGVTDTTAPAINVDKTLHGDTVEIGVSFSEPIYQSLLPLFGKTADGRVSTMPSWQVSALSWHAAFVRSQSDFRTIGIGVCDTAGNAAVAVLDVAANAVESTAGTFPAAFRLSAPYPNPFNGITVIDYEVPSPSELRITLYDALGRQVQTVLDAHCQPGKYRAVVNASVLPSGVYLCRLTASSAGGPPPFARTKRLLLVK